MVEPGRIGADPVVNTLLRVRQGDQAADFAQRLDNTPLRLVGVLELIEDDDRVHDGDKASDTRTAMEKIAHIGGIKIKAHAAVFRCKARAFCLFRDLFRCFLRVR